MSELRVETAGAIATLWIDNPGKRNAVTVPMWQSFVPLLDELAADASVKVLVVRGAGSDFSAGADISDLERIFHDPEQGDGGHVTAGETALANFPKPTIAAIDGFCVGGGWEIAGACDIRLASARSTFGITPSRLGILYPFSGVERLVRIVGPAVAKYLLFSGDLVTAETARSWGMVSSVYADAELWPEVARLAETLASRSQLSIHAAKQIIDAVVGGRDDAAAVHASWQLETDASAESAEGIAAFLAKRPPRFEWNRQLLGG